MSGKSPPRMPAPIYQMFEAVMSWGVGACQCMKARVAADAVPATAICVLYPGTLFPLYLNELCGWVVKFQNLAVIETFLCHCLRAVLAHADRMAVPFSVNVDCLIFIDDIEVVT